MLLMLGTNDGLTLTDNSNRDSYRQLLTALRAEMKPDALLILITPPHATENPDRVNYGYAAAVENARSEVLAIAAEENLPVIDAYADSPIQAENEAVYQNVDGLHLNRAGYQAFAQYLAGALHEISDRFPAT